MKDLIIIMVMLLGTIVPLTLMAMVGFVSIRALGLNPSQAPKIMVGMIIAMLIMLVISMSILLGVFKFSGP